MTKSLSTSLAIAHVLRRASQLLQEYRLESPLAPAQFYIDTAFFSIAAVYCLVSLLLLTAGLCRNSNQAIDQEIEVL